MVRCQEKSGANFLPVGKNRTEAGPTSRRFPTGRKRVGPLPNPPNSLHHRGTEAQRKTGGCSAPQAARADRRTPLPDSGGVGAVSDGDGYRNQEGDGAFPTGVVGGRLATGHCSCGVDEWFILHSGHNRASACWTWTREKPTRWLEQTWHPMSAAAIFPLWEQRRLPQARSLRQPRCSSLCVVQPRRLKAPDTLNPMGLTWRRGRRPYSSKKT
jgi:hypothetical protein